MSDFIRYPSTDGLRVAFKNSESFKELNEIKLRGTVKIHGTNASIVFSNDGSWFCQSRNRVITLESDNYGFCRFIHEIGDEKIRGLLELVKRVLKTELKQVVVFGELAGKGINQNVAVASLPRFWAIFGIQIIADEGKEWWLSLDEMKDIQDNESRIYNVVQFEMFDITIDFAWDQERIEATVQKMTDLTLQVEKCCPVGKFFGTEGIGEGIVWSNEKRAVCFKTKGEEHAKCSTRVVVKKEATDGAEYEFADKLVTDGRLQQGIEYMREMNHDLSIKSIGVFLQWIQGDIKKEEQDLIDSSIYADSKNYRLLSKAITRKATAWFKEYLQEHAVDVVLAQIKDTSI